MSATNSTIHRVGNIIRRTGIRQWRDFDWSNELAVDLQRRAIKIMTFVFRITRDIVVVIMVVVSSRQTMAFAGAHIAGCEQKGYTQ